MSAINTNGLDVNYPIPGINNSSQGFRDNFASIKNNLNIAATEISDLQNKAVVKSALDGVLINNDMANTLISNATTRSFRASMYNLGNALSGSVLIDVSLGDVQYGNLAGNVQLQFTGWAPYGTQSQVQLQLGIDRESAGQDLTLFFPAAVVSDQNYGVQLLENYENVGNVASITAPPTVTEVSYLLKTIDCGNTISIQPINRPFKTTQLVTGVPPTTGVPGDVAGAVRVGPEIGQVVISNTLGTGNYIILGNTSTTAEFYVDMPIVFTGNTNSANSNIAAGTTYYVKNIANTNAFTVSTTVGGSDLDVGDSNVTFYGNPSTYLFVCVNSYNSTAYERNVTATSTSGNITLDTTSQLTVNSPVIFTGDMDSSNSNLVANTVYYVTYTDDDMTPGNIKVSQSRVNGVAGTAVTLGNSSPNAMATCYVGEDIWRRINLSSW